MKRALLGGILALALGLGASGAAQAEGTVMENISIGDLQKLLQDMGYRAETVTNDGNPYIKSTTSGYYWFVNFYDCVDAAASASCRSIEFVTGSFTATPRPTADAMEAWNRDNWWGFGVYDSANGQPYLRNYISTTGGVTDAYIKRMVELWDWRVSEFAKFIDTTAKAGATDSSGDGTTGVGTSNETGGDTGGGAATGGQQ